jgi:hypothetical protein
VVITLVIIVNMMLQCIQGPFIKVLYYVIESIGFGTLWKMITDKVVGRMVGGGLEVRH